MPTQLITLPCSDLLLGMYVCELDRPWTETPFPVKGFHIRRIEDLETLRLFCKQVVIDTTRGVSPRRQRAANLTILSSARKRSPPVAEIAVSHDVYKITGAVKQEIDTVERLYQELSTLYDKVIISARNDKPLRLASLTRVSGGIRNSIIRCPDAFIWFLNTNSHDSCLLNHSLRAAVWSLLLTRHIGYSTADMDVVFLGTLLADIGMAKLPESLVRKTGGFGRREYLAYRKHVRMGEDLLRIEGEVDNNVTSIVRAHHERHDGLGFPRGQRGDQIPVMARIANLAYCYDRLLKHGARGVTVAPANAVRRLYKQRKLKFTEQLVFEFIQVLGLYPAGSIVELTSREIAIVVEQNPGEKLQPKIALVTDDNKSLLKKPRLVNPVDNKSAADNWTVIRALELGSYAIQPENLREEIFGKRIGIGKFGVRV
ncbi:MAG: DUF3391 domain-containing protein [Pseudohongiellaceae bacterium]